MNVSAIVVTRGNVDLGPVMRSLPEDWEQVIYHNDPGNVTRLEHGGCGAKFDRWDDLLDLSVYGRYAAIEYASHDLIYVQDDDVIVSDPQKITRQWGNEFYEYQGIVANMPQEFRHDGYTDSCLVGFGACFHRDLPARAFERFKKGAEEHFSEGFWPNSQDIAWCNRTCDVVFTTLAPRVLVDVPKEDREFATDESRMYRQRDHVGERTRMLELARMVRDA